MARWRQVRSERNGKLLFEHDPQTNKVRIKTRSGFDVVQLTAKQVSSLRTSSRISKMMRRVQTPAKRRKYRLRYYNRKRRQ